MNTMLNRDKYYTVGLSAPSSAEKGMNKTHDVKTWTHAYIIEC